MSLLTPLKKLSGYALMLASLLISGQAVASCIDDAASCIVNAVKAQYYAVSAVAEGLEFSAKHPDCVAAIVAQDYVSITTMTAVSGLAAAGLIGSSESSCKHDLYGKYASQIAGTLALVASSQTLKDIASGAVSTGIETAMSAVPFPGTLPSVGLQLTCGCAIADTGADMIDKIKKTAKYTAATAKACAGFAGCVGAKAWNALKDTGEVFYQVGECIGGPNDCGENAPMTEESYYQEFWQKELNQYVEAQISNGKLTVSGGVGYVKGISPAEFISSTWHTCEDYYINHRYSGGSLSTGDHAQRACNTMRDRFYADAAASRGVRMDDEVFPKVALSLTTPYLQDCAVTYKNTAKQTGGVEVSNEQAQTYGSAQLSLSSECTKEMQFVLGKAADGAVVAQADSALWETKNTYKANNFDIKGTYNKLMASGSKYDVKLKEIAKTAKAKIATSGAVNQKTVLINLAYEKQANQKWSEYKAKCPASAKLYNSLNDTARAICLTKTADYLGVAITKTSDVVAGDDSGSVNFAGWKTLPVVYSAALASFEKSDATQTLADARVTLSFATHESELNAIAAASINEAKTTLKPIRQAQEQDYDSKLMLFSQIYADSIKCELPATEAITHTCKYAQSSLDEMFNAWHTPYLAFVQAKDALDKKIADSSLPFAGKDASDSEFVKLLSDIDKATKRSPQLYMAAKSKPGAVVKESKSFTPDPVSPNKKALKSGALDAAKSRKAETLDNSGLKSNDSTPDLNSQSKQGDFAKGIDSALPAPSKPTIRGMRAAPGMVAVTPSQVPQSKVPENRTPASVPPAIVSLEESQQSLKNRTQSMAINSGNKAPSIGTVAVDSRQSSAQAIPSPTQAATGVNIADASQQAMQQATKNGGIGNSPAVSAAANAGAASSGAGTSSAGSSRSGSSSAVVAAAPPPAPAPVKNISGNGSLAPSAAAQPPFDKAQYQRVARQNLESKWLPQCKNDTCKAEVGTLITNRINEVLKMLDNGTDLRVKALYDNAEASMDSKYNPLMQAKVEASKPRAVEYEAPKPSDPVKPISNKPVIKKINL